jgi:N-sulfoglucosamine sulfohydrolase
MNLVYIHSHDTGRWIAPYGFPVATPALSRFSEQGWTLRNAHCAGPTCSPSRAALLTGQWPHCSGMLGLRHRGFTLRDPQQHIAAWLAGHGYHCVLSGIQHVARSGLETGYHEVHCERENIRPHEGALRFLAQRPQGPFMLDVGFFDTHREFPAADPAIDQDRLHVPAHLPDSPAVRGDLAAYHTSVQRLDRHIGEVLDAIDAAGLAGNTLVTITTDHGPAFPSMKCNLTARGTGVLLMMRGPGFTGGQVSDALVSQIDVVPTWCAALDVPAPPWLQGVSLLPLTHGSAAVRDELFAEVTYHAAYEPMRSVRTLTWNYIRRYGGRTRPVLPNLDNSPCKSQMVEQGWADQNLVDEELFHLIVDPAEQRNLATDPTHAAVLAQLRQRLDAQMHATDDPLLHGAVAPPDGAVVTDSDAYSPAG